MKKLSQITLPFAVFLFSALPAFAQEISVDPCHTSISDSANADTIRKKLCDLTANNSGSIISKIIIAIIIIAAVISLFFLVWGGIRWILSGGDKGKVDAARQTIVAAIIGLIITFLAYFILNLVLHLFGLSITNLALPSLTGP